MAYRHGSKMWVCSCQPVSSENYGVVPRQIANTSNEYTRYLRVGAATGLHSIPYYVVCYVSQAHTKNTSIAWLIFSPPACSAGSKLVIELLACQAPPGSTSIDQRLCVGLARGVPSQNRGDQAVDKARPSVRETHQC